MRKSGSVEKKCSDSARALLLASAVGRSDSRAWGKLVPPKRFTRAGRHLLDGR